MGLVQRIEDYQDCRTQYNAKQPISDTMQEEDSFEAARRYYENQQTVYPFRSADDVNAIVSALHKKSCRDMCLFVLGCNSMYRISDILEFRWRDIIDSSTGEVKYDISKTEKKTKKPRRVYTNDAIRLAVQIYRSELGDVDFDAYMFTSNGPRKAYKTAARNGNIILEQKPLSEQAVSGIIRGVTKDLGLWTPMRKYSTHSMRKTGATAARGELEGKKFPAELKTEVAAIEVVQGMLGHTSARTTARYIDADNRLHEKIYQWMNLGLEALEEIIKNQ